MMDIELAKELYFKEMETKAQLDSRLGIYSILLSAVGGIVAFFVRNAWPGEDLLSLVGLLSAIAALVVYVLALLWVLRATLGYTYERIPYPAKILDYSKAISLHFWRYPGTPGSAAGRFDDFIVEHCSAAATKNASNNLRRSARFYRAGQLLLWVIVLCVASGIAQGLALLLPRLLKGS